jgi:hypothetical protein
MSKPTVASRVLPRYRQRLRVKPQLQTAARASLLRALLLYVLLLIAPQGIAFVKAPRTDNLHDVCLLA